MSVKRKRDDDSSSKPSFAPKSTLLSEDGAFPRGGASAVLTPLEIKQATNEATRDLFAASTTSSTQKKSKPTKKSKKTFKNKNDKYEKAEETTKKIQVESLSFSKLSVGSIVLGQITKINTLDLVLSLPDNLLGYIPITNISEILSERIESKGGNDEDEEEDDEEEDEEDDIPQLSQLFKVGQWLRALVVENEKFNNKKRIELSIDPLQVNEEIELDDLSAGNSIQGSVKSIEDHGIIMDIGRKDITGFLSNKELSFANIEPSTLVIGQVLLLTIFSKSSNNRTLTLTATPLAKKVPVLKAVTLNKSLIAGTLVEVLITSIGNGLIGEIFGSINATVNLVHSGVVDKEELLEKFKEGQKVKGRVVYSPPSSSIDDNDDDNSKVLVSILDTTVGLTIPEDVDSIPVGEIVKATVKVVDNSGLYLDIGSKSLGYVHISKVSDERIDDLKIEDAYSVGKELQARVLTYSYPDNLYILSTQKSILNQKYLLAGQIPAGEKLTGTIDRILPKGGVIVKLWEGCTGIINELHISDIKLANPELKYKPGMKVTVRVLKVDSERNRIELTLKKSLVNSKEPILTSYENIPESKTPGTIVLLQPRGAVVEFFNGIKGFLPLAEISEAFIKDPKDHFKLGQSVAVRVIFSNPDTERLVVSCRNDSSNSQKELQELEVGSIVSGSIVEKTKNDVVVSIGESNIRGVIPSGLLTDGEDTRVQLKKLKVAEKIDGLVVLEKNLNQRFVTLTMKESIVADVKVGKFPGDISQLKLGDKLHGYIKNITEVGIFIRFAGNLTGLALKHDVNDDLNKYKVLQSVECYVIDIDFEGNRFLLSLKSAKVKGGSISESGFNPIDESITSRDEFIPGKLTKAQIVSVKETQLNVKLANGIQGRIDVSQIYDDYESIPDIKNPLGQFKQNQIIDVRIIGFHDARNHTFLAISHRNASHLVYELSIKKSDLDVANYTALALEDIKVGSSWLAFINNLTVDFVWVHLSPSVRGRINLIDLTNDSSELDNIEAHYPIGSAIKCKVIEVDSKKNNLKLSVRSENGTSINSYNDVNVGDLLPAFVSKVTESYVVVVLGGDVSATSFSTDALDDYSNELKMTYLPHQLVKAKVISVDGANKKINVTLRPSETSDDKTIPVVDKYTKSVDELKVNDVLRGIVKNVSDGGLFVSLGSLTARVQIRNLSDSFLKDWKKFFKAGQVVTGKVVSIDKKSKRIEFTLKESAVTGKDPKAIKGLSELVEGEVHDGIVKKVESFGVFVTLTDKLVSGLCHRSEVADVPLHDLTKVFAEGDKVKVKILKVDVEKNRLALGLKASYFLEDSDVEMEDEDEVDEDDEDEEEEDGITFDNLESDEESQDESEVEAETKSKPTNGLSVGFDWTGTNTLDQLTKQDDNEESDEDEEDEGRSRKRRKKSKIVEDKTATLNTKLPQSVTDFERLLVGSPNSSIMWMNYMAFQIQLSEIEKAREIGQRALKSINFREEQERLNIWIALLNLENSFGTDQTVEDTFKEATQFMDSKTIHLKLASIYSQSEGKAKKAEELYDITMKKFGGEDLSIWITYGNFLFDNNNASKARSLLDRALKMLPPRSHKEIITKFAQLEYTKGEAERGRTLFEGLISSYPRKIDLWIVYIDYEIKNNDKQSVETLFERVINNKLSMKQAKFFFKKWLSFEDKAGDKKKVDYVKAKAAEYVSSRKEAENE